MDRDGKLPASVRESPRLDEFARRRREFRTDRYRPDYHFVPPGGLLHDPNGACYWNGRYHLFYQFWPPDVSTDRSWSEAMHWGHAVSEDLVHWRDLPVALSPEDGPEDGCYSGQALVEDDRVLVMYFGTEAGNCVAAADDEYLTDFERSADNPVVPIDEEAPYEVFDPCLWREGDTYHSLSGWKRDGRTSEFHFSSTDLSEWEYRGTLVKDGFHTDPEEDGAVPNFFELDGSHVLLFFSHDRGPQYYVGDYHGGTDFDIRSHGRLNSGPVDHGNLHAPSVLHAEDRSVAFFNVVEGRRDWRADPGEGWAGVVSLPRALSLDGDDLRVEPVEELTALRTNHRRVDDRPLAADEEWVVPDIGGASLELRAEVDVGDAAEVGLSVLRSPDGDEATSVTYWADADALGIELGRSSENPAARSRPPEVGSLSLADDERLDLRVFVDRSIVEVFANGRRTLTTRVYPARDDSVGLSLSARRGAAHLESLDVWDMESIWS
ncbi:glycoside hydrolase family 32 protein [Halosimplex rubrum]|uniref:beta-fructofuranosidase n=1 Tax=Halosimplex rubrum TaxID=869889 RepID=A0A7D5SR66_9EURY|nr:glycoside hydrolase family 32 protein [Halosimplex rubrum]QLH78307.1 glycoside hydrolase family 32 protein [Halosimplex rubrum]